MWFSNFAATNLLWLQPGPVISQLKLQHKVSFLRYLDNNLVEHKILTEKRSITAANF